MAANRIENWKAAARKLERGYRLQGPEPALGCFNTGHAPTVLRVCHKLLPGVGAGVKWIVCKCDLDLSAAKRLAARNGVCFLHPTEQNGLRGNVHIMCDAAAAASQFAAYCEANAAACDKQAAEAKQLAVRVKAGRGVTPDAMAAALELGDMGIL